MVSADPPAPDVARAHRAVEPLHNQVYFSPEQDEYLTAVGLRPGRMRVPYPLQGEGVRAKGHDGCGAVG